MLFVRRGDRAAYAVRRKYELQRLFWFVNVFNVYVIVCSHVRIFRGTNDHYTCMIDGILVCSYVDACWCTCMFV